jgi:hypothetical protein
LFSNSFISALSMPVPGSTFFDVSSDFAFGFVAIDVFPGFSPNVQYEAGITAGQNIEKHALIHLRRNAIPVTRTRLVGYIADRRAVAAGDNALTGDAVRVKQAAELLGDAADADVEVADDCQRVSE